MAVERRIKAVGPLALTLNGGANGLVTVSDTKGFRVKSQVVLQGTGLPNLTLEIKRVLSKTQFYVGEKGNILQREDISQYTLAASSTVHQPEQDRPGVPIDQHERAVYEEEPVLAKRVILVDEYGEFYDTANPLKVQLSDGSIEIGTVNADVDVQLTDKESAPGENDYDIVRLGDGEDELDINPDGSINVSVIKAATPTIVNLNVVAADTEYSYALPAGTKHFTVKDRKGDAKTRIAYVMGTSGTNFKTVDMGNTYEVKDISTIAGLTIYFQSSKASRIIEIESWK